MTGKNKYSFLQGSLTAYSQIFFAENKIFALLLLLVSFLDYWAGITGLLSILTANFIAYLMGYNSYELRRGIYGFNPLLVGLGIGVYFAPAWNMLILVVLAAMLTFFISIIFEGILSKYGLPFLSIPFLIGIWFLMLAFPSLQNFGLNERGLYTANELYSIGGLSLVKFYDWWNSFFADTSIKTYFLSLGSIFFRFDIFTGIVIAFGLLIHSRISFILSLIGFYTAFYFYQFVGIQPETLNYSYYGFNFILSAIAIGGYFLIPSKSSFIWTIILIPIIVLITIASDKLFSYFHLSVYALPFNLIVIGFIYSLKIRVDKRGHLTESFVQQKNPETNAYLFKSNKARINSNYLIPFNFPFYGKWTINQGFNGEYTHKDEWQHAWDFIITDNTDKEFKGQGNKLNDYFCYEKSVLAPADGTIVELIDSIDDNPVGDVNLKDNWGNSIVIQHAPGLYSQMSHLQKDSFKVTKGAFVKKGQFLAAVGNSGRSSFPHLHFQFQASPFVGSKTIPYHFQNYIRFEENKVSYVNSGIPEEKQTLSNISPHMLLKNAFNWVPGDKLHFQFGSESEINKMYTFEANATIYNQPYLYCPETDSHLYFRTDNSLFWTENYVGSQNSPLYYLYLALYKLPLGYYDYMSLRELLPVHHIFKNPLRLLQDFAAPFFFFLKAEYVIDSYEVDNEINTKSVRIKTSVITGSGNSGNYKYRFDIKISDKGIRSIDIITNHETLKLQCHED